MANPNEPYVEKTVVERPTIERREEVRVTESRGSNAGWWVAALVAIVAVVGVFFMFNQNSATEMDLQAARDTGRAEAMVESAATSAQNAAARASDASANAASSVAEASRSAADSAAAAADRTAEATQQAAASAGDAATDAADTAPVN